MSIPTPVVFRPRRLRILAVVMSAALCGIAIGGWFALPLSLRNAFTTSQRLTLLAFLAVLELIVISMAASYVRADESGLSFRNGLRSHAVTWAQVYKILLRPGDPWAIVLLLPDDGSRFEVDLDAEKRQLLGIQANDGATARQAVDELRRRLRSSRG